MTAILTVQGVTKRRNNAELFDPLSFTLSPGQGLGIYGYNDSGKSTLLDIIAGLEKPSTGQVQLNGRLGYAMQHVGYQEALSFKDNLYIEAYLSGLKGQQATAWVEYVAQRMEITPYWHKRYSKGSSGMKGRLPIATALLGAPQLILLDEVYSFLDQHGIAQTH